MLRLLRERRPTTRLLAVVLLLRLGGAPGSADAMNLPAVPAPAPGTHGFAPVLPTMYWADLLGESPMPTEAPNPELVRRATDPRTCGLESGLGVYRMLSA